MNPFQNRVTLAYDIEIKNMTPQPMVSIRTKCDRGDIGPTLGEILPEVWKYLRRQGLFPSGPPFTLYHGWDEELADIEGGMPVESPIEGEGRITAGEIPGGRVVSTIHVGPYEKLVEAYDALHVWVEKNEQEIAGIQENQ